ncbi:MAG TPA: hypothetical protein VFM18_22490, partial [Methanosarcina sp.]|nr:hypothetical protein [Methanosarcina sp.]
MLFLNPELEKTAIQLQRELDSQNIRPSNCFASYIVGNGMPFYKIYYLLSLGFHHTTLNLSYRLKSAFSAAFNTFMMYADFDNSSSLHAASNAACASLTLFVQNEYFIQHP